MDKRDNTEFDLLTVNETSVEPPVDDGSSVNSPRNLAIEATFINHNFSQQVNQSDNTIIIYWNDLFKIKISTNSLKTNENPKLLISGVKRW